MTAIITTQVLVVGAGPTGLMLANQLRRRGVDLMIVDQNPGPSVATKALGVQARTLEIYAHLGIAEEAVALGQQATGANLWAGGRHAARVPLGDIGRDLSPFPFLLILGQDDNERLLGDHLKSLGTQVSWSTRLAGLSPADNHVLASLERDDGSTVEVEAEWLAGCDGAHSAVRDLNQIGFPGAPYEHLFFVADTRATGPMVPDELNIYLWRRGFYLFFPMRGSDHWRVVGILPSELRNRDDLEFEDVAPSIGAR
ncbi:MAG: FAD-dependent monooxygenase, partial [Gammaproteobacteria bacterium]|nr:FAD-dependent monooxygenase [Gammaproteobacteria bacterium]